MKIVIFNGSDKKGCTWNLKNMFIDNLGNGHEITEFFFPRDLSLFCKGCALCATKGISYCPHDNYLKPIREAIEASDLLVFTSPVYVFHITGALKNLLDHLFVYWMPHRPEDFMMKKQAVVITDCLGMGNRSTAKTINHSLDYWGVARRYNIGFKLMGSIIWSEVSDKRKNKFEKRSVRFAKKVLKQSQKVKPRIKIKVLFKIFTLSQKMIGKKFSKDSLDYKHWENQGWLKGVKPWKSINKEIIKK